MSEEPSDSDELIAIGQVGKPRGIHGEAFLKPLTDFPERFESIRDVTVEDPEGNRSVMRVERVRTYGSRLAVKFRGLQAGVKMAEAFKPSIRWGRTFTRHLLPDCLEAVKN